MQTDERPLNDSELLERLYLEYGPMMLRAALGIGLCRADAEDIVSDTFDYFVRRAAAKLRDMDEERRKATLLIAARHRARNFAVKQARLVSIEAYYAERDRRSENGGEDAGRTISEKLEARDSLAKALASLPPELAGTLYLNLAAGFSGTEIAELSGENLSTVHKRIRRGKKLLAEELRKEGYLNE